MGSVCERSRAGSHVHTRALRGESAGWVSIPESPAGNDLAVQVEDVEAGAIEDGITAQS